MVWSIVGSTHEINVFLYEYAAAKLCFELKIGPKISSIEGYDIVCYKDCIEFRMEKCKPLDHTI